MNKRKQYTKSGFTIIEVLVVITIIALMASVGGGYYMGTYKRMLVKKAARDFILAAKYARIMAIERQKPYRIEMDTTNGGFSLATDQLNEETEQTAIVFSPNGTAQSAVIQIGDGENHYTVNIYAATGKAKVQSGTVQEIKITTIDLDQE